MLFLGLPLAIAVCVRTVNKSVPAEFDGNTVETFPCEENMNSPGSLIGSLPQLAAYTQSRGLNEDETIRTTDSLLRHLEHSQEVSI